MNAFYVPTTLYMDIGEAISEAIFVDRFLRFGRRTGGGCWVTEGRERVVQGNGGIVVSLCVSKAETRMPGERLARL